MESSAHRRLKLVAARLLVRGGCSAAAVEVRCPIARHRVDAAGFVDPLPKAQRGNAARRSWLEDGSLVPGGPAAAFERGGSAKTVIVECKQSRADFLVDSLDAEELLAERERLTRVRAELEERIVKVCEPHLRVSGSSLFPELEEWDLASSRVSSYRAVVRELRRIDERIHGREGGCKFWTLAHYRLADWLYLAAPPGVVKPGEVPPGWGLIEVPRAALERGDAAVAAAVELARVRVAAPERGGKAEHRLRLLRNIAVAATRRGMGEMEDEVERATVGDPIGAVVPAA